MQRLRVASLVLLLGCPGAGTDTADSSDTGSGDSGVDPNAPVIDSADLYCYLHTTGDEFTQWVALATAHDKQGTDTIETLGRIDMSDAGGAIGTATLICESGSCSASWHDGDYDVACDETALPNYDFSFVVTDIDGNESAPVVIGGRKEADQ